MRLAVVVNRFPTLSETFIYNKVLGLQQVGVDVTVLVHSSDNDATAFTNSFSSTSTWQLKKALMANGITGLPFAISVFLLRHPVASFRLLGMAHSIYSNWYRAMKAWVLALPLVYGNFDIIHFEYSGLAAVYVDAFPLLTPAKLITSCRGAAEQIAPLHHPERAKVLKSVFHQIDKVHCVSQNIQNTVQAYGLDLRKSFIIYPSIDTSIFIRDKPYPHNPDGPFRLLSVGRLHWKKGFEFGLLAVHKLIKDGYNIQYQIIGGGDEEEKLRLLIHELGLEFSVTLLGRQPAKSRPCCSKRSRYISVAQLK